MYFTFLDNGLELHIKTNCSGYSQSEEYPNSRKFTFCQNDKCCSTGHLPAPDQSWFQNHNCFVHKYKYKLGDCSKFNFDFDSVEGNVTYGFQYVSFHRYRTGIKPEWVKLVLGNSTKSGSSVNGAVIKCSFEGKMEGSTDKPPFMNFHCKPEGKFFERITITNI